MMAIPLLQSLPTHCPKLCGQLCVAHWYALWHSYIGHCSALQSAELTAATADLNAAKADLAVTQKDWEALRAKALAAAQAADADRTHWQANAKQQVGSACACHTCTTTCFFTLTTTRLRYARR